MFRIEALRLRFLYIAAVSLIIFGLTALPSFAIVTGNDFPGMIPPNTAWWDFFKFFGYFGSLIGVCVWGFRKGCPFIDTLCLAIFLTPIGGALYVFLYRVPGSENEGKRVDSNVLRMSNPAKAAPVQVQPTPSAKTTPETIVTPAEKPADAPDGQLSQPVLTPAETLPPLAPAEKPADVPVPNSVQPPEQKPIEPKIEKIEKVEKPVDAPVAKQIVRPSSIKPVQVIKK